MKKKSFLQKIWKLFIDEFSSVKLAIVLLVFLSFTTLIGTILPQEPMVGTEGIIKKYGEENYIHFKTFGLTDVFHSWWYLALFTTFAINLTVASFKRVFPRGKNAFKFPPKIKIESINKLPISYEFSEDTNIDLIKNKLKEKGYKVNIVENQLIAQKGNLHRLGASVTHIGIMILLIGSTFSIVTGFNGMVQLAVNEGFYLADLGQKTNQLKSCEKNNWLAPISKMPIWFGKLPRNLIKVNKTWKETYENGSPKQWYSDLSIYNENKKEIYRKTISVNNPIQFMGLDIYQSNWGRFLQIGFNEEAETIPLENIDKNTEGVILPLSEDIALKLIVLDENILEVYTLLANSEKLLGKINLNNSLQIGPLKITYLGTETMTGLQFKSNPGDFLIYPGVAFMILGVLIAFGAKKRIWAEKDLIKNRIYIGGTSDRLKKEFYIEFEKIINDLRLK